MINTNTKTNDTENVLSKLNLPSIFYPCIFAIIILIIVIFTLIYSDPSSKTSKNVQSNESIAANFFIIFTFTCVILLLCFIFLPNFKEFIKLFNQIGNVIYVVLYTIFIILLLRLLPSNVLQNYSLFILIPSLLIAIFLFYNAFKTNYVQNFDINYERIKMIILYFCFITIGIVYYSIDPGGYIKKYFGVSSLFSLILAFLGFLYLIVLFTLPDTYDLFISSKKSTNLLENFSSFSIYGTVLFIIFLIVITSIISSFPNGFFSKIQNNFAMVLILIVCVLWVILLISNMFTYTYGVKDQSLMDTNLSIYKKTFLALIGIIFSGILISYLVYNIQSLTGKTGIPSFILSILLVLCVLTIIYKIIYVQIPSNEINKNKNSFFSLLFNIVFYIPCIFAGFFDFIIKSFIYEYKNSSSTTYLLLLLVIILAALYFFIIPFLQVKFNNQGGKQLLNTQTNLNILNTLSDYESLNGNSNPKYQYAISFWVFIDSAAPNTNSSYNKFTSIFNYGGKPNVLYKANTNTLMITMNQEQLSDKTNNNLIEYDEYNNRIIYVNNNFLLQKWNNIVINYNGGTLDVFINGELVKSSNEVIPYMKIDTLTTGTDNGINGGICNVIYFKTPISLVNIHHIYNNLKDSNPPIVN